MYLYVNNKNIHIFGPKQLLPHESSKAIICDHFDKAVTAADVIVMLRIQKERMGNDVEIKDDDWHQHYGLNSEKLKFAKSDAIVMHPGPMNRGVEISDGVADGSQSVILEQVKNGVLMRQALIHHLLSD